MKAWDDPSVFDIATSKKNDPTTRARREGNALFTQLACVNSPPSSPLLLSSCSKGDFGHVDGLLLPASSILFSWDNDRMVSPLSLPPPPSPLCPLQIVVEAAAAAPDWLLRPTRRRTLEPGLRRGGGTMHLSHFTHRKPEEVVPCIERAPTPQMAV